MSSQKIPRELEATGSSSAMKLLDVHRVPIIIAEQVFSRIKNFSPFPHYYDRPVYQLAIKIMHKDSKGIKLIIRELFK